MTTRHGNAPVRNPRAPTQHNRPRTVLSRQRPHLSQLCASCASSRPFLSYSDRSDSLGFGWICPAFPTPVLRPSDLRFRTVHSDLLGSAWIHPTEPAIRTMVLQPASQTRKLRPTPSPQDIPSFRASCAFSRPFLSYSDRSDSLGFGWICPAFPTSDLRALRERCWWWSRKRASPSKVALPRSAFPISALIPPPPVLRPPISHDLPGFTRMSLDSPAHRVAHSNHGSPTRVPNPQTSADASPANRPPFLRLPRLFAAISHSPSDHSDHPDSVCLQFPTSDLRPPSLTGEVLVVVQEKGEPFQSSATTQCIPNFSSDPSDVRPPTSDFTRTNY